MPKEKTEKFRVYPKGVILSMKNIKRSLCVLLALLMTLATVFTAVSCGESKAEETTAAAPAVDTPDTVDTTEEDTSPKFADADYGGDTFTVYMRTANLAHYAGVYIFSPENASDIVNEQTAIRNQTVEDKYNIVFEFIESNSPQNTIKTDVAGGDIPYDLVLAQRCNLAGVAYEGLLRNFNELDIDYTTTWWDANAAKIYGYKDKLFAMPNDVSVSNLAGCRLWWFNKAVLENFNLTSPYDYVHKNEWTIDTFFTMVKAVSAPGPAGQIGVYGLSNEEGSVRSHMQTGIGSFYVEVDEEDNLVCKVGTEYAEKTQDFFDKLKVIVNDPSCCIDFNTAAGLDAVNASKYNDQFYHTRALFSQGHFLFTQTSMNGALNSFEEMEKGYGAVMNPKYNSDQPEYYHKMDSLFPIWCMPKDPNANLDQLANIMDFWAYTSSHTVMEAYYELTLKTKRASDPMMAEMLDIVKGSIHYYITDIFGADIGAVSSAGYNSSIAQAWKAVEKMTKRELLRVQDKIAAIE